MLCVMCGHASFCADVLAWPKSSKTSLAMPFTAAHVPSLAMHNLQATLEEVCEADLLLHVLDASSPSVSHQREAVLQVT